MSLRLSILKTSKTITEEIQLLRSQVLASIQMCDFLERDALNTTHEIHGSMVKESKDLSTNFCQMATILEVPLLSEHFINFQAQIFG